jgi:ABC-type Mn/Zn transport systems, ATPase component
MDYAKYVSPFSSIQWYTKSLWTSQPEPAPYLTKVLAQRYANYSFGCSFTKGNGMGALDLQDDMDWPMIASVPTTLDPILRVADLQVRYHNGVALGSLAFEIERGERIAIVGPNGAGKSTLLKSIAGLLKPTTGSIQLNCKQDDTRLSIAYVPQRSDVDWSFPVNVSDVVMMGLTGRLGLLRWPRASHRALVARCLERVGMQDFAKRQIGELSGGQQQRVFIARALAQEAELLLMDEPLTGLDIRSQETIFKILDDLKEQGVTVLVSTHDLNQAAERFDRVMLLNKTLLGFGDADSIFTPQRLAAAYGGHLRVIQTGDSVVMLEDGYCGARESETV